jgi:DNA-binding transcriptional ArsR family regulator
MNPDVFDAIANPIRRELLAQLRESPKPVRLLAAGFDRGRPTISEHLRLLKEVGLVREEPRGRERIYHLEAGPLREIEAWLDAYRTFWQDRLANLGSLMDKEQP